MASVGFDPLQDVLGRLEGVIDKGGEQFEARCPAHEDRRASLSVARGDSGGVVLHCHAGCAVQDVLRAIGLTMKDIMPQDGSEYIERPKSTSNSKASEKARKTFATAADAVRELESNRGPRSGSWTYHNAGGEPVGLVLRWNLADGKKDILPVSKNCKGWIIGGMAKPHPLYGLPELASAKQALVFEGELCCDAARKLGFAATTSPHGAKSADKADWTALAGKDIAIFPDHDKPGRQYAEDVRAILERLSPTPTVRIVELPGLSEGEDLIEWLERGGTAEQLAKLIDDTRAGQQRDDRPAILIGPDEHLVTEAAVKALANAPDVFQRANVLVHVLRDDAKPSFLKRPKDSPRIEKIPLPRLREILSREASWWKYNADGERKRHRVDGECVKQVDARGYWPGVRPLEGIIEAPALRPDGSIIAAPGFDPLTGLLHEPNVSLPHMKSDPTHHDAHAAALELLDIVCDFPFAQPEHRSAYLAGVLTPFARHAFEGCVPLFLIDKNVRGAGGGLLANTIGIITTGRDMTVMAAATDDAEWRKKITSIAVEALPTVLIDNIAGRFGWPSLDAALTSTTWSDRLLKENRNAKARLQTIWYATGNNVALQADTARRCLHIRIETDDETPEERTGFVHADLKAHVLRNRGELVRAALTVLRAYFVAGCPSMGLPEWGSFEQWSRLIRGAIVWLGLPDPGATRRELSKQSDVESSAAATLILVWHSTYGDQRHTAAEAIDDARRADPAGRTPDERFTALRNAILDVAGQRSGELPTARTLAMKLHHLRKRVIGGRQFDCVDRDGTKHWYVKQT